MDKLIEAVDRLTNAVDDLWWLILILALIGAFGTTVRGQGGAE